MEPASYPAVILLAILCAAAVLMSIVRLPGVWLISAAGLGYGWWTEWQVVGVGVIAVLIALSVVAEVLEFLASVVTARKAGASGRAAWGGLLGALLGMIFLSFLFPIPILGSVFGALLGCFFGAAIGEMTVRKEFKQGTRVGFFSALGFAAGMVIKMAITLGMAALLMAVVVTRELSPDVGASEVAAMSPSVTEE